MVRPIRRILSRARAERPISPIADINNVSASASDRQFLRVVNGYQPQIIEQPKRWRRIGWYSLAVLVLDTDNDLLILNDAITPAVGEITHLTGKVLTEPSPHVNALGASQQGLWSNHPLIQILILADTGVVPMTRSKLAANSPIFESFIRLKSTMTD